MRETKPIRAVGKHFTGSSLQTAEARSALLWPVPSSDPSTQSCSLKGEVHAPSFILPKTLPYFPAAYRSPVSSCPGIRPLPPSPGSSFPITPVTPENPTAFLSPLPLFLPMSMLNTCCFYLFNLTFGPGEPFGSTTYWVLDPVQVT